MWATNGRHRWAHGARGSSFLPPLRRIVANKTPAEPAGAARWNAQSGAVGAGGGSAARSRAVSGAMTGSRCVPLDGHETSLEEDRRKYALALRLRRPESRPRPHRKDEDSSGRMKHGRHNTDMMD